MLIVFAVTVWHHSIIIHCFYCPPVQRRHLHLRLVSGWHRGRRRSPERRPPWCCRSLPGTAVVPFERSPLFPVRALLQQPFLEKQKLCFVCPRREEVGCFNLVVWYPKKASSTWCLIIVTTRAGLTKTFWLYPRLHDWTKHNSGSDTIAYSHIWFDISLLFQPRDVLSSLAWKDLTPGYFVKAFLENMSKPRHSQLSVMY